MWHPFRKKSAEPEQPANNDTITEEIEEAAPEPTAAEKAADISDLLTRLSQEKDPGPQERKLLSAAFSKAAGAILGEAELATPETVSALADYTESVEDAELHGDAVARLGAVARKYPQFADTAVAVLIPSLVDPQQDVRHSAVYALKEIAEENPDYTAIIFGTFIEKTECAYQDVREDVVTALTSLAVGHAEYAADTVKTLSGLLAKEADPQDKARQEYKLRIQTARRLGEIGLAHESQKDAAIAGLKAGLGDEELFVKYRTIESLTALGKKYEDAQDDITAMLESAKDGAIFVVAQKLGAAVTTLNPPVEPEKTPAEIEAERKAAAEREKAIAEAQKKREAEERKKAEAEKSRKTRFDGIKTLANKLPGAKIK